MTRSQLPPETEREVSRLKRRVSDLERVLGEVLAGALNPGTAFTLAGGIYVSESVPWVTRVDSRAVEVVALLGTAASSGTTTLELRKNGAAIGTFSINAGELSKKFTTSNRFSPDVDRLTVAIVAAGVGARDLDVIVRFR